MSEFEKYARSHCGISSLKLHDFQSISSAYVSPTIIEERQLNIATMDVFSRLMMDRIIFLGAPIYDDAANIIQAQLLFLESVDADKDIEIYINSPGGSVSAGLGIYDTMQLVNSDVATICTGLAASMGAVLLTAGAKGKRSALPHSRVMIHQPLGGAQGQASDIEITAREFMKTKRELYEILAAHSGVSVKKIEKDADRDYWLSAREAKDYGLIDEVLSKREKYTAWHRRTIIRTAATAARSAAQSARTWRSCSRARTATISATNVSRTAIRSSLTTTSPPNSAAGERRLR